VVVLLGEIIPEKRDNRDQSNNPKPVKGWLLKMPVVIGRSYNRHELRKIYWRYGIRHEVHQWLISMAGQTGTYVQWEEEDPTVRWLYTGSNQLTWKQKQLSPAHEAVQMRFRDKGIAALFKLTWWDKL
jgi:hypothetical protein